jgi:hypothetical protein
VAAINLATFSFLGLQLANPNPVLHGALAVFGMLSCVFWFIINTKAQTRINYWHACLAKLEPSETEPSQFRIFTGDDWRRFNKWPTFQSLFNLLPITFFILWAGVLLMSLVAEEKQRDQRAPIILFQFNSKTFNQHNSLKGDAP